MNICEMNFLWNELLWNELFVKWTFCEMNFLWNELLWNELLWNELLWNDIVCEMILLWNDTFVKWTFVKRYICEMNFCETMHPPMIAMNESSLFKFDVEISHIFGISYQRFQNEYYSVNCGLINNSVIFCKYLYSVVDSPQYFSQPTQPNQTNTDLVYLKPFPSQSQDSYLIAIDKNNREDRTMVRLNPAEIQYMSCKTMCPSIPIVEQMDRCSHKSTQ